MGFFDNNDRSICGMDLNGDGVKDYCDDFLWEESKKTMFGDESEENDSDDIDEDDYNDMDEEESDEYEDIDSDDYDMEFDF